MVFNAKATKKHQEHKGRRDEVFMPFVFAFPPMVILGRLGQYIPHRTDLCGLRVAFVAFVLIPTPHGTLRTLRTLREQSSPVQGCARVFSARVSVAGCRGQLAIDDRLPVCGCQMPLRVKSRTAEDIFRFAMFQSKPISILGIGIASASSK